MGELLPILWQQLRSFKYHIMARCNPMIFSCKVNHLEFCFMQSLHNKASLRNLNFCAHSARLLRKLIHVLLQILSNDTVACDSAVSLQSKRNCNDSIWFHIESANNATYVVKNSKKANIICESSLIFSNGLSSCKA